MMHETELYAALTGFLQCSQPDATVMVLLGNGSLTNWVLTRQLSFYRVVVKKRLHLN